jgi:hypothetical protein
MNLSKKLLPCLLVFALSFQAQSQTLKSLYPAKFYTQSEPTVMKLTINGDDIWPNYLTITQMIQVMHVHFKKDGKDEVIRGVGLASDRQIVEFISTDWLSTSGTIEIYITTDAFSGMAARRSNSVSLPVESTPSVAPVITDLSNHSFSTGLKREDYYIRVYGKNFGEIKSTYASVGGYDAPAGWEHLEDGVMDIWIPTEVINKAGSYPVVVHTKYGESNAVNLKIEMPVAKVAQPNVLKNIAVASQTKTVTTRANNNAIQAINKINFSTTNKERLNVQVIKGIRVTMNGIVADGPTKSTLENFISSQTNVFVVDNQLQVQETNGNININLKGTGVDKTALNNLKKSIETKAASMKLSVAVSIQ